MEKIMVLADREMAMGFRLAGVTDSVTATEEDAEKKFLELFEKKDAGIIILQDEFVHNFSHKTKRLIEGSSKPVVITIGGKGESAAGSLQQMIKRAIGITLEK